MLAAATPGRIASDPGIPTVKEDGGPEGMDLNSWVGLVAPRGTPPPIIRRLGEDIAKALATSEVQERYRALGVDPAPVGSAEITRLIRTDLARNRELIKRVGITPE